jgi:alpha-tubulin suppressor-like RCC1 family protein
VEIVDVACGVNHAILLDRKKRPYTLGFGGYGRLGHAEPKDEMIPRLIKFFDGTNRGVTQVYAGSAFTMAVNEVGALFLWGQNKPTGEANMYPKPVQDLSGWKIKAVGCCNRSIIVAADDTLISWGPSPTYGELGYGEHQGKSSTTPKEVKTAIGICIQRIACGFGHSLLLARSDTEEDKAALEKLPVYTPENPQ